MVRLEELTKGTQVGGILPNNLVTIVDAQWHGSDVVELTYKDASGSLGHELVFRDREPTLELVTEGTPWSFTADGANFRLVSEAYRIRLAHLFDPLLAVHTSLVEPLPHQITAVYGEMLTRQPLRFLLADDPGAGKTIMAGLLMRELLIRGDLHRCLVVCPGSLAAQWQDELYQKFHLPFEILTNDRIEAARTGNAFAEMPLLIVRLDKLSRNDDLQAKLAQTDWDLVVCDEAHKMSASFFGGEIRETKRYKLGKLLSSLTRHFLLMSATPHNGKEEDFQLFMALLDGDRFEGRFRDGVHVSDTSDLMRRLVKEDLLKFDGKPLFPERKAYAVEYKLSDLEAVLYKRVTEYVREEFNRADALGNEGRKGTVGFALTILQRRLASSPEAIYQSLTRRRERLQKRLREEELLKRGSSASIELGQVLDLEDIEDDLEDVPSEEREAKEEEVADLATASRTIAELQVEISLLQELEQLALQVRRSGTDKKWEELSKIILDFRLQILDYELEDPNQKSKIKNLKSRKLVIFTEHRDTLNYLAQRIRTLLGRTEAVVTIHGGMGREERRKAQEAFTQDIAVQVLIATDAAGEGINLQRAHLMVNYDLPWNPNRLEQRYGRIHRIGQTEVCHLWNLVAKETREGDVYLALLKKLEIEQEALGGKVFDVLGKAIASAELRELLIQAIRYGDRPDVRDRLNQVVQDKLDQQRLRELLSERALARDAMDIAKVQQIKAEMERAAARRLQPHFIASFFLEAFEQLGGTARQREGDRYEITHVPAVIRDRGRQIGVGEPLLRRYERICFEKESISIPGKPLAAFVCPGHPLLDAAIDLTLERHRDLLKQGSILVDDNDMSESTRALVYLEHGIQDARTNSTGTRRVVSRRMQYVEIGILDFRLQILDSETQSKIENQKSEIWNAGYAPYLNYRSPQDEEKEIIDTIFTDSNQTFQSKIQNLKSKIENEATSYAISQLVGQHLQEVKQRKEELIAKTMAAVKDRLTKEINYWDHRAEDLKMQESAGKANAKINSTKARQRADELQARLLHRLEELEQERRLSPLPPVVVGGALVVSLGLLQRLQGKRQSDAAMFARETQRVEKTAMAAVMAAESQLGYEPKDVSQQKCGYDIESRIPQTGQLRFIEVKGRIAGAATVTVTKNEIIAALNQLDAFILALVQVPKSEEFTQGDVWKVKASQGTYKVHDDDCVIRYLRQPFHKEPDFAVTSVNYDWRELWQQGTEPF
ncbi:helicase-related protein [Chroococcidiopsis thermalis]|uniref:Helicase domain protein n=1 Tax=Chroococcidiopsis thermalis (strain PCC 7203) TaxID=251229 RepID=K9U345_CHRTP|nr:helicase-related protein [Chroococcidiopsis thermalis]AFY89240.1 helicase domain protein [Chroococcidiopsis thermalis PCC 7203]